MDLRKMMFNALLGFVPDILIAWGYAKLTDGGWQDFWIAILVLQALYLALWLKRALWAWLVWWVYGKRVMARTMEKYFRDNKFPRPEMWVGGLSDYLEQILGDEYERPETKLKAAFEQGTLNGYKLTQAYSLFMMMDLGAKRAIERYGRYAPERQHSTLEEQEFS